MEAKAREWVTELDGADGRESWSAFLDDELDEGEGREVARALSQDPAARARWSEYSLIGDALRGELQVQPRLMQTLRQTLDQEPTVLAPMPRSLRARPVMWLAAAAAVSTISWTIWDTQPADQRPIPLASRQAPALQPEQMMPYLAAHQDYAQAVIAQPEMQFTTVSLSRMENGQ